MPIRAPEHADPAVQAFIETDPFPENIRHGLHAIVFAGPGSKKLRACALLLEAFAGLRSYADIEREVQEAYSEPSHTDRHLLFLICWIRGCLFRAPLAQVHVLIGQAKQLIGPQTPPELRAWIAFLEMVAEFERGDTVVAERISHQVLSGLAPDSPHYLRIAGLMAMAQLSLGKGAEAETAFPEVMHSVYRASTSASLAHVFMGCAMTGDLAHAMSIAPALVQSIKLAPHPFSPLALTASLQMIALMAQRADLPLNYVVPEANALWMQSTQALLARKPRVALDLARAHNRQAQRAPSSSVVWADQYCLIRAELACGHGDAALRLMTERHERGTVHYFDDFYVARALLLVAKPTQAADALSRVYQSVKRFRAEGRLEFEIALACELQVTQLLELLQPGAAPVGLASEAAVRMSPSKGRLANTLIYADPAMGRVMSQIERFGPVDIPVLVTGETGTGKELVARALHDRSPRSEHPFVEINCGALNEALIESELFGHRRGAFTGAQVSRKGLFEEAGRGTLFLDEIGDISTRLQVALLRVLETGDIRPLGSNESVQIRCRVIAATNADLDERVAEGRFRPDLLYRLKRLHLQIPPLRQRPLDIDALATHFVDVGRQDGRHAVLQPRLKTWLQQQTWPGNARELRNCIERMRVLNSDKLVYDLDDLMSEPMLPSQPLERTPAVVIAARTKPPPAAPSTSLENSSFRRIKRLRAAFSQNPEMKIQEVAHFLGVTRQTAARYLNQLAHEGFVQRVCPTASVQSHYYAVSQTAGVNTPD